MNNQHQYQLQQQQRVQGGILPPTILTALDRLVDRLNASSGFDVHNYNNAAVAAAAAGRDNKQQQQQQQVQAPIRALLVGTNEGVGLSRSFGSAISASHMSEEVLSSIETVWATLPSASPPHVMAAAAAAAANDGSDNGGVPIHHQPPHPLLRPLAMGDQVRTATAFYDNCTLMHVHMAPLVVTIIATPNANIGAIRSTALPLLQKIMDPVKTAILVSRREAASANAAAAAASAVDGGGGNHNHRVMQYNLQQQQQQLVYGGFDPNGMSGYYQR